MKKLQKRELVLAIGAATTLAASGANAAVPTEVTDMFTTFGTDAATLFAAAIGLLVIIRGGTGIIKISKKFLGAAGA